MMNSEFEVRKIHERKGHSLRTSAHPSPFPRFAMQQQSKTPRLQDGASPTGQDDISAQSSDFATAFCAFNDRCPSPYHVA